MADHVEVLRIVIASPADTSPEREIVASIVRELNNSICADRSLRIDVTRWETDAYPGFNADGPQGLIDPIIRIEDCDVLVGIFWKRFGTPTRDSRSGTEHEFRLAYESWKRTSRPQVMVYFNQKPHTPQSKEETDQWGQVLDFRKTFPKEGLWWAYKGVPEFEKLLRAHLSNFIRANFPVKPSSFLLDSTYLRSVSHRLAVADYFTVQSKIIEECTQSFVGRASSYEAFQNFLRNHKRGYFVVRGGPGQGKTAFSCYLVKKEGYVHHFINRTGGRTDSRLILRSLTSQLLALAKMGQGIPESITELTKVFDELLHVVAVQQKRVVVLIDALDELPNEMVDEPPYLVADTLPEGVFFVVTSRPSDRLNRLQERRFAVPQELYDLGPLDISEMREILKSRRPDITGAELEHIAEASQGNPLYLRAVADELEINPSYNLQTLPTAIEGFFRTSTASIGLGNAVLGDVLGLLSVARMPLSLTQLSKIAGNQQRDTHEFGIRPIRQFLLERDGYYTFYHARFHEFVTKTILYEDEIRKSHYRMADWLQRPENKTVEYRAESLAYHLFEAGDCERLISAIDEQFLAEKVQRLGYGVLEDIELLACCLLSRNDPSVVERCVSLVESLINIIGSDIISEAAKAVQRYRSGPESFRSQLVSPVTPRVPGLDIYVGVLPKSEVAADFFEVIPIRGRLVIAIGDAPGLGLKSAFVARFIGSVFHRLVEESDPLHLGDLLDKVNAAAANHEYFERVSMLCAEVDPKGRLVRLANAGHPYPVHYSARLGRCDILPLRGDLLDNPFDNHLNSKHYEQYDASVAPGDVLILVTDGLTEDHVLQGEPYGYRFTEVVEARAREGAKVIGEAILDSWKGHLREEDAGDDVSVIVVKLLSTETAAYGNAVSET